MLLHSSTKASTIGVLTIIASTHEHADSEYQLIENEELSKEGNLAISSAIEHASSSAEVSLACSATECMLSGLSVNKQEEGVANCVPEELAASTSVEEDAHMKKLVAELEQQLEQAQVLFDQNNSEITTMKREQGVLQRKLEEARAAARWLSEETVQLRTEIRRLNTAIAAEREGRIILLDEIKDAKEAAVRARKEEVLATQKAAAEVAEAHAARAAVELLLEQAKAEVQRVQKEAEAERMAAAWRDEGLRRKNEAQMATTNFFAAELEKQVQAERSSMESNRLRLEEFNRRYSSWADSKPSSRRKNEGCATQ